MDKNYDIGSLQINVWKEHKREKSFEFIFDQSQVLKRKKDQGIIYDPDVPRKSKESLTKKQEAKKITINMLENEIGKRTYEMAFDSFDNSSFSDNIVQKVHRLKSN